LQDPQDDGQEFGSGRCFAIGIGKNMVGFHHPSGGVQGGTHDYQSGHWCWEPDQMEALGH